MLQAAVLNALNAQLNLEFSSSYLYLAMSADLEAKEFPGLARWMRAQSEEERAHGMRIFEHIVKRHGRVVLAAMETPPQDFGSPLEAFRAALAHEREVTAAIDDVMARTADHGDNAARNMLRWFVDEQVEEEDTAAGIVHRLEVIGDAAVELLRIDDELGERGSSS